MMKVNYRLSCLQPVTNSPLTTIKVGQEFDLALYTQDLRDPNLGLIRGVFAAYVNIQYNKSLTSVRTYEVQSLTFPPSMPLIGGFFVRILGRVIGPISYDNSTLLSRQNTAKNIQNSINNALGLNKVSVINSSRNATYDVKYSGYPDIVEPLILTGPPDIIVSEKVLANSQVAFFNSFQFSQNYPNGKSVVDSDTGINALGAFTGSFTGLGPFELEVVRVRMVSKSVGIQNFILDINVSHPMDDTLVYGNWAANPPEYSEVADNEISLLSTSINITN
jgi:hypothetical protein